MPLIRTLDITVPRDHNVGMTKDAATITGAIQEIRDHAARGEHGTLEFPCHIDPATGATPAEAQAKVAQVLEMLGIDAAVEFDNATLTIII